MIGKPLNQLFKGAHWAHDVVVIQRRNNVVYPMGSDVLGNAYPAGTGHWPMCWLIALSHRLRH